MSTEQKRTGYKDVNRTVNRTGCKDVNRTE